LFPMLPPKAIAFKTYCPWRRVKMHFKHLLVVLAAVLLLTGMASLCSAQSPEAVDAYNKGLEAARSGRLQDALMSFQDAIRKDPDFVQAHLNLGIVYEKLGQGSQAKKEYQEVLRIEPQNPKAHYRIGMMEFLRKDYSAAKEDFETALKSDSTYVEAMYGLGLVLDRRKDYDRAIATFRKAINLKSDYSDAYYGVAKSEYSKAKQSKKYDRALKAYQEAISKAPDHPKAYLAYYYVGLIHYYQKNFEEAVKAFDRSIMLNNGFKSAYVRKAQVLRKQMKYAEAEAVLKKVLETNAGYGQAHFTLADIYWDQHLDQQAMMEYLAASKDSSFRQAALAKKKADRIRAYIEKKKKAQQAKEEEG